MSHCVEVTNSTNCLKYTSSVSQLQWAREYSYKNLPFCGILCLSLSVYIGCRSRMSLRILISRCSSVFLCCRCVANWSLQTKGSISTLKKQCKKARMLRRNNVYFAGRVAVHLGQSAALLLSSKQTCPWSKAHTTPIVCTSVRGKHSTQSLSVQNNQQLSQLPLKEARLCPTN